MIEFTESGYTEVFRGPAFVSRHRQEREAIESVLRDAECRSSADYEIRRPVIRATVRPGRVFEINATASLP